MSDEQLRKLERLAANDPSLDARLKHARSRVGGADESDAPHPGEVWVVAEQGIEWPGFVVSYDPLPDGGIAELRRAEGDSPAPVGEVVTALRAQLVRRVLPAAPVLEPEVTSGVEKRHRRPRGKDAATSGGSQSEARPCPTARPQSPVPPVAKPRSQARRRRPSPRSS